MADFHTKMNQIFEIGKINQSKIDSELTQRLHDEYEISVFCSSFSSGVMPNGKTQGKFYALISVRDSKNELIRALQSFKGAGNYGVFLNSPTYGEEFRLFAQKLANTYFEISGIGCTNFDEIVIIIYEFNAVGMNHLYGKSCLEVKKYLHQTYNVDMRDVVGIEDNKYYVLVDQLYDFTKIIENKDFICKKIFNIMKKYDHFRLLENDRVKISFLLKPALDDEELSSYLVRKTFD